MRLQRFHVQEQLAFIVHRASRVDATFAKRRFERRRFPQLERLGGLDVVVAVHEHRRCARRLPPFTQYYGMAARGKDGRLESNARERVTHPLGRAANVGSVLRARADAWDAEQLEQLVVNAAVVFGQVTIEIGWHWRSFADAQDKSGVGKILRWRSHDASAYRRQ